MSLQNLIKMCAGKFEDEGVEFDADEVVECIYRDYAVELVQFGEHLIRAEVKRRVATVLKRRAAQDPLKDYEQLSLHGFEKAPRNVSFYDGERVRYIGALSARKAHLISAMKLRDDQITFCGNMRNELRAMFDLIEQHQDDITFGEAIKREQHATA